MKFKSNIEVQAGIEDKDGQVGSSGQILASTGSQVDWIDPANIVTSATDVIIECKNTSGVTIAKGTPVYQTGNVGATAVIEVAVADASDEDKMAAIGLLQSDLINNAFGYVVVTGELLNITTSPIDGVTPTIGDTIYVKPGGGLTLTKPTGVNFIQNVGLVGKVSGGNAGSLTVSSIMRSNDVPTPLYIDHDNQRLGIGTTSPSAKLDVNGEVLIASGEFLSWGTSGTTAIEGSTVSNKITFRTQSTERMRIDSSGNVGIGTTGPDKKLEVSGDIKISGGDYNGLFFENASGTTKTLLYQHAGYDALVIKDIVNNADRVTFKNNGNVGIGTTNPSAKLDVAGTGNFTGLVSGITPVNAANFVTKAYADGLTPGVGVFLPLAGGTMTGNIDFANTIQARFLTSDNSVGLKIQSSNTDSFIDNEIGDISIRQKADNKNIIFQSDNGSGGAATYILIDGSTGAVELSHYGSNKFKTTSTGVAVTGQAVVSNGIDINGGNVDLVDNVRLRVGTASDLQIYHDGSNSYIAESGTGLLNIFSNGTGINLLKNTGEFMAEFATDGAVSLFYDNAKKFETTSTGVGVTGDINIDSALLSNQENTDVDTGTETVSNVAIATYTAAFFDFVIKKTTNVRSGTVYACHDGTNVEFTETSTQDLGDTSDVTLSVDISGTNMRLLATVTSDDWSVKSLIRAI